jgi:hypothetical protein
MVCDEDRVGTDATSDDVFATTSSNSNYSAIDTSAQMIRSPGPTVVSNQSAGLLHSLEENDEPDRGIYQSMRTSPGHHKRPACVLDEEDGEESEERI